MLISNSHFTVNLTSTLDTGVDEMYKALVTKLGAGSMTEGRGAWTNSKGEIIEERSCPFQFYFFFDPEDLDQLCKFVGKLLDTCRLIDALFRWHQQQSIFFTLYLGGKTRSFIVDTGKLEGTIASYLGEWYHES